MSDKPYVPKDVHYFRWIEEAEHSSHRSASLIASLKHTNSDPMLHM